MDGYGPALPAVGPVLVPLGLSHVIVGWKDGYGPALPAVGPVLVPLGSRRETAREAGRERCSWPVVFARPVADAGGPRHRPRPLYAVVCSSSVEHRTINPGEGSSSLPTILRKYPSGGVADRCACWCSPCVYSSIGTPALGQRARPRVQVRLQTGERDRRALAPTRPGPARREHHRHAPWAAAPPSSRR